MNHFNHNALAIIPLVVSFLMAACNNNDCKTVVIDRFESPSKKFELINYYRDCGAIGGARTGSSIIHRNDQIPRSPNFLINMGPPILEWKTDSEITLSLPMPDNPNVSETKIIKRVNFRREYSSKISYSYRSYTTKNDSLIFDPSIKQIFTTGFTSYSIGKQDIINEAHGTTYIFKKSKPIIVCRKFKNSRITDISWEIGEIHEN